MPENLRNPRSIAESTNDSSNFDKSAQDYDAEAGVPRGVGKSGRAPDYSVNVSNPPEKPAPCRVK